MSERDTPDQEGASSPTSLSMISISVVICAHTEERWNTLTAAVDSVRRQSHPADEIIVVIDHNPGLLERAQVGLSGVIVVANSQGQGLSGARNTGVATARGEVVAFLDDDAVATPDWLAQLVLGYAQADVIAVGGSITPDWQTGRPNWFPAEFDWVVGCSYQGMPQVDTAVRNLIGCNMSVRREIFERVGGFHRGIGRFGGDAAGCEETEFFIRIHQKSPSVVILYRPEARVFHVTPAGRTTWRYFWMRCRGEGYSKALISQLVGERHALSSEQVYVMRTLPVGILHGLSASLHTRDTAGLRRSCVMIIGLAVTSWTYVYQRAMMVVTRRQIGFRAPLNNSIGPHGPRPGDDPGDDPGSPRSAHQEHESSYRHG